MTLNDSNDTAGERRPGEVIFCTVLVAFSVTAFHQAFAISGFSGMAEPGVFPMLASGGMVFASAIILAQKLSKSKKAESDGFFREVLPWRNVVLFSLVGAYAIAMPWIGFLIATSVFLALSFAYLWRKPWWVTLLLTLGATSLVYLIFREVFQVVLPVGTLTRGLW